MRSCPLLCVAIIFAWVSAANTAPIIYGDFSTATGLTLNGSATVASNKLRLTNNYNQTGSAFLTNPVTLNSVGSFSTYFKFQITQSAGTQGGGDGLVFVLQNTGPKAIGSGMGYSGMGKSLGIEFDTFQNNGNKDIDGNHIGIDSNGNLRSLVSTSAPTSFNNGNIWNAWIDYDGTTRNMQVRVSQTDIRPTAAALSYSLYLPSIVNPSSLYVGFTSGAGNKEKGTHEILSWKFYDTYNPVPLSSAICFLGSGLLGLLGLRRRYTNNT